MIGCGFLYIDFETIATIFLLLGIMCTMDGNIEMFIHVFQYLKQYQNFRLFFIVYNLAIEAHLQIFEAYCSNFWPVVWWSALFNHKLCFTCYV
jgi:hypothetical protein